MTSSHDWEQDKDAEGAGVVKEIIGTGVVKGIIGTGVVGKTTGARDGAAVVVVADTKIVDAIAVRETVGDSVWGWKA